MACEDLNIDINTACSEVTGDYEHVGWVFPYDNVVRSSVAITDCKATFHLNGTSGFKVYDKSLQPFAGTQPLSEAGRYVVFHDQAVIPLFVNNQINAKIANYLGTKRIVLMLENQKTGTNGDARYPIFGLIGGLKFQSSTQEVTGDVAHDVTLQDMRTGYPALFFYDTSDDWTTKMRMALVEEEDYYYADGMTISNGELLEIAETTPESLALFIKLPDNSVVNGGDSYSDEWTGDDGNVKIVFTELGNSGVTFGVGISGNLSTNIPYPIVMSGAGFVKVWANESSSVTASQCVLLAEIHCKNAEYVDVQLCTSLTAYAVAQMILEIYAVGKDDGTLELNKTYAQINAVSTAAGAALTDMINNKGWTVSYPA